MDMLRCFLLISLSKHNGYRAYTNNQYDTCKKTRSYFFHKPIPPKNLLLSKARLWIITVFEYTTAKLPSQWKTTFWFFVIVLMPCAFMYTIQNHKRLHKTFYGFYVFYCISIKFIQKCCKNFNVNIFILFLVLSEISKKQKEIEPNIKIRLYFSGCGGRTRTCDLRVMSPTSFQLLYPAIYILRS